MTRLEQAAASAYEAYVNAGAGHVMNMGPYEGLPAFAKEIARAQVIAVLEALGPVTKGELAKMQTEFMAGLQ